MIAMEQGFHSADQGTAAPRRLSTRGRAIESGFWRNGEALVVVSLEYGGCYVTIRGQYGSPALSFAGSVAPHVVLRRVSIRTLMSSSRRSVRAPALMPKTLAVTTFY